MVMVTSEKTIGKIEEALDQAGADWFITKPFTAEELTVRLAKVIERAVQIQVRKQRAAAGGDAIDGAMPRLF
jgi:two-component system chemotaxis response regulator CheY